MICTKKHKDTQKKNYTKVTTKKKKKKIKKKKKTRGPAIVLFCLQPLFLRDVAKVMGNCISCEELEGWCGCPDAVAL